MDCPSCGAAIPEGGRFCVDCGAAVALACVHCGFCNPAGARFCAGCGARLGEATAPADAARTKRAPEPREAERRQLTVLFCDLVGSTELSGQLDPEDMATVIRAYHSCCSDVVKRWGGHVAKYMGDGVLAYFGYPQAHEDDAERAVRAGLQLTRAVSEIEAGRGALLNARVGIATGRVVVGELTGEGMAQEHAVVGETPNLAARLEGLASPGNVVISQRTRHLIGGLFELEGLGQHRLKGFGEPVRIWQVLGESDSESRFEALRRTGLTPLVGRDHEMGLLLDRWERAKDGEGQVALLSGEPGIGKSRIMRALRERLGEEPHTRLTHYCSPFHTNSALHPVINGLERAAGFERDDPPERRLDKLETLLEPTTKIPTEVAPLLAPLLSIPTGDRYSPLNLTPKQQKQRAFEALADQITGLAAKQPVLVVYEDLQWADPSTLELLDVVVERVQRLPVLVVMTFRPEFGPPWAGHAHATMLSLSRLTRRQGTAMVERIGGGKRLPPEILDQVLAKTDGVPLFVEELTKTVLESNLLTDAGDRYETVGRLPDVAIPTTLHDSLMARLDRLPPVKEAVQIGAVIGREFSHELLAEVAQLGHERLEKALDELVDAQLLFRRGVPPEATYSFKHALVQDAAYDSLLKSRRQEIHARIASILENRFATVAWSDPAVLAHHLTQADRTEQAVVYWQKAGQQAAERFAHKEALAHLTRALDLLRTLPQTPEGLEKEIELQTALGVSLMATRGPVPEVEEAYGRARDLAEQRGDRRQLYTALWGLWFFHQMQMHFDAARDLSYRLLEIAKQEQDTELLLQGHHAAWTILLYGGELLACREHAEQGLALYDPEQHRDHAFSYGGHDPGVCCRYQGSLSLWLLGYPDQAVAMVHDAIGLAEQLSQPFSLVIARAMACYVHQLRGEPGRTREQAEATIALAEEQGFRQYLLTGQLLRGWAIAAEGNAREGLAAVRESLDGLKSAGADLRRSYYLALLAETLAMAGEIGEARSAVSEAWEFVEESGERWWEAELQRLEGELEMADTWGQRDDAEACIRAASEIARKQRAKAFELRAALSLARLRRAQGRHAEAQDLLAPVCGWFTEGFDTLDLKEAKALLEELA